MRPAELATISLDCVLGQSDRPKGQVRLLCLVHMQTSVLNSTPVNRPRRAFE